MTIAGKKGRLTTIDEYIAQFPVEVQAILTKLRSEIRKAAPGAEERISYQMPGFFLNGRLVWFGVQKGYIGFYPTGSGIEAFKDELSAYEGTKGSAHFPLDQPMPYALIRKIVKYRVAENTRQSGLKKPPAGARRPRH